MQQALAQVYPKQAGAFTQALMELGATVCGPNRRPDCENCPCSGFCRGYQNGTADTLPVKLPKKEKKEENRTVFILSCDGCYALEKRPSRGLLAGLWQFPNVEGTLEPDRAMETLEGMGLHPKELLRQLERSHIFTHIRWDMRGFYIEVAEQAAGYTWFSAREIEQQAALPTAFRQFWEERDHV